MGSLEFCYICYQVLEEKKITTLKTEQTKKKHPSSYSERKKQTNGFAKLGLLFLS